MFVQPELTSVTGHKWNASIVPPLMNDTIMDSVGLPKGLIDTLLKMKLRKSVQVYAYERVFSCIIHLTGILIGLLFLRSDVEASILRLPGQLFQHKRR
jgi:hypothetical protein